MIEIDSEWTFIEDLNKNNNEEYYNQYNSEYEKYLQDIINISESKKLNEINLNIYKNLYDNIPLKIMKTIFFVLDCRGGLGYRELAYKLLEPFHYSIKFRNILGKLLYKLPEYGRYDNLLYFMDTPLEYIALDIYAKRLIKDKKVLDNFKAFEKEEQIEFKNNNNENLLISFASKWAPSENKKNDKNTNSAYKLAWAINLLNGYSVKCNNIRQCLKLYRKEYLSYLRKYLNIPERIMCNQNDMQSEDFYKNLPYGYSKKYLLKANSYWIKNDPIGTTNFLNKDVYNYLEKFNGHKNNYNNLTIQNIKEKIFSVRYEI